MACTRCGGMVGDGGLCLNPSCGGNDGILNNEPKSKEKSSCWVATAYYGDSQHPKVQALRQLRNSLIESSIFGVPTKFLNKIYHLIGASSFGIWWVSRIHSQKFSLVRIISKLCLVIAHILVITFGQNK